MRNQFKNENEIFDATFRDISQLYRANARSMLNINQELALIQQYSGVDA